MPHLPHPTRQWELDALRGLMLVLMTLTHMPTGFSPVLSQPFGFVSAAEGFVFMSALMVGRVYGGRARRQGIAQQLMAAVDDAARAEHKTVLVLDTVTGGDAEELRFSGESERIGTQNFDEDTPFGGRVAIV